MDYKVFEKNLNIKFPIGKSDRIRGLDQDEKSISFPSSEFVKNLIVKGIAYPLVDPGTPIQGDKWLPMSSGVYTNFGGVTTSVGDLLVYDTGQWVVVPLDIGQFIFNPIDELYYVRTGAGIESLPSLNSYIHDQGTPSSVWAVNHGLGKYPSVVIKDSAGTIVIGKIDYLDKNTLTITFNGSFSGTAYCN